MNAHQRAHDAYTTVLDFDEPHSSGYIHDAVTAYDERRRASQDEFQTYCALIALCGVLHARTAGIFYLCANDSTQPGWKTKDYYSQDGLFTMQWETKRMWL